MILIKKYIIYHFFYSSKPCYVELVTIMTPLKRWSPSFSIVSLKVTQIPKPSSVTQTLSGFENWGLEFKLQKCWVLKCNRIRMLLNTGPARTKTCQEIWNQESEVVRNLFFEVQVHLPLSSPTNLDCIRL